MLVGDDLQLATHDLDQLARTQKEIRAGRPPVGLVADGEGLIQQDALGIERLDDVGKQRAPEVVRDHDRAEPPVGERPRRAALQIRLDHLQARDALKILKPREVDVDRGHRMAALEKKAGMATPAAGQIQNRRRGQHERREADDPGRGRSGLGRGQGRSTVLWPMPVNRRPPSTTQAAPVTNEASSEAR